MQRSPSSTARGSCAALRPSCACAARARWTAPRMRGAAGRGGGWHSRCRPGWSTPSTPALNRRGRHCRVLANGSRIIELRCSVLSFSAISKTACRASAGGRSTTSSSVCLARSKFVATALWPSRNLSRCLIPTGVSQAADVLSSLSWGWLIQVISGRARVFGMMVGVVNRVGCCARAAVSVSIRRFWVVSAWP